MAIVAKAILMLSKVLFMMISLMMFIVIYIVYIMTNICNIRRYITRKTISYILMWIKGDCCEVTKAIKNRLEAVKKKPPEGGLMKRQYIYLTRIFSALVAEAFILRTALIAVCVSVAITVRASIPATVVVIVIRPGSNLAGVRIYISASWPVIRLRVIGTGSVMRGNVSAVISVVPANISVCQCNAR